MMWLIMKICFGLLLLATVIDGGFDELKVKLKKMASRKRLIEEMFKPMKKGFIKEGNFGIVFKGVRVQDKRPVALKFCTIEKRSESDHEFEIYTYLNAINNTDVERFGISPIFYYEEWEGYMLTVFSLFDGGDLGDNRFYLHRDPIINGFILFRNFVLQSKYMHGHGVCHNDITVSNIMIRKSRTFLIDFNLSTKMNRQIPGGTCLFASRNYYKQQLCTPLDDWESFLYTMCHLNDIRLEWEGIPTASLDGSFILSGLMKENTNKTITTIENCSVTEALKQIFVEFSKEIFENRSSVPRYDYFYELITAEIDKLVEPNEPAIFTWLKEKSMRAAKLDLEQNSIDIADIRANSFSSFDYPEVHLDFFTELKERMRKEKAEKSQTKGWFRNLSRTLDVLMKNNNQ